MLALPRNRRRRDRSILGIGNRERTLEYNRRWAVEILPNPMPHKRITRRIPNLRCTVRWSRGALEVLIDCGAYRTEGCAWDDMRYAYLGALLGYAE